MPGPTRQSGMSLIELSVGLALFGIALGIAGLYLRPLEQPLETATVLLDGFLRQARVRAMATTTARRVSPAGPGVVLAEAADTCSASTWTPDPKLVLELPRQVSLTPTTWSVCFTARGLTSDNVGITLDAEDRTAHIEVLLGGTTRVSH